MGRLTDFLLDIVSRQSIENPSTPLSDPDSWLYDAFGASTSEAGVSVTAATARTIPAVYRAVSLVSEDVAKLPFHVFRTEKEGKRRDTTHPVYRILRRGGAGWVHAFAMKQAITAHALLHGSGYAYIRRQAGRPVGLELLDPILTRPSQNRRGELRYVAVWMGSLRGQVEPRVLDPGDVLHIRAHTTDGLTGVSVVSAGARSMGLTIAAEKFSSYFFKNGNSPRVALQLQGKLETKEDIERLRASWQKRYGGLENAHKPAILENGMDLKTFSLSNTDAQLLEMRQFQIRDVANWFGVPPHKLGDNSKSSYNSLEQENQSYLDDGVDPWLTAWEEECWMKMFTEAEKKSESVEAKFSRSALVRVNTRDKTAGYRDGILAGYLSRDEVREMEGLPPIPDGEGQEFFRPVNIAGLGEDDSGGDGADGNEDGNGNGSRWTLPPGYTASTGCRVLTPDGPGAGEGGREELTERGRALLGHCLRRALKRAARQAERAARDPSKYWEWREGYSARALEVFLEDVRPSVAVLTDGREAERLAEIFYGALDERLVAAADARSPQLLDSVRTQLERMDLDSLVDVFWTQTGENGDE